MRVLLALLMGLTSFGPVANASEPVGPFQSMAFKMGKATGDPFVDYERTLIVSKNAEGTTFFQTCVGPLTMAEDCRPLGNEKGYASSHMAEMKKKLKKRSLLYKALVQKPIGVCSGLLAGSATAGVGFAVSAAGFGAAGLLDAGGAGGLAVITSIASLGLIAFSTIAGSYATFFGWLVGEAALDRTLDAEGSLFSPAKVLKESKYLEEEMGYFKKNFVDDIRVVETGRFGRVGLVSLPGDGPTIIRRLEVLLENYELFN